MKLILLVYYFSWNLQLTASSTYDVSQRSASLATSIKSHLDYLMLKPVKVGDFTLFLSGNMKNASINSTLISSNSLSAPSPSNVTQVLWAVYKISGLDIYIGYENDGTYVFYANDDERGDIYAIRKNDPASCGTTTSSLPSDNIYTALSANCLQWYYTDKTGNPLKSFKNSKYDPRLRPWYQTCKTSGKRLWSQIYLFFTGDIGITYTIPLYKKGILSAIIGIDYTLGDVQKAITERQVSGITVYITDSNFNLVATSSGEPISINGGLKSSLIANNTIIRESSGYLYTANPRRTVGSYTYLGSDGSAYIAYFDIWTEDTKTVTWYVIAVSASSSVVVDNAATTKQIALTISGDLQGVTDDAVVPAKLLAFLTGLQTDTPLSNPVIRTSPAKQGISQQSLWGAINSYPNSMAVSMAFANKAFLSYYRTQTSTKDYLYVPVGGGNLTEYTVAGTTGKPLKSVKTIKNFDVLSQPFYANGMKKASWTSFYDTVYTRNNPTLSFAVPIFNSDETLLAVASVSRQLDRFLTILHRYVDEVRVAYIIDTKTGMLIGTSSGELIWNNKTSSMITPSKSVNYLIRESSAYLLSNSIYNDDTTTIMSTTTKETILISTRMFTDSLNSLKWLIVVVDTPFSSPTLAPVSSPSTSSSDVSSSDVLVARDAAVAGAIFAAFIFVIVIVILVKVFMKNKYSEEKAQPMSKNEEA